MMNPLAMTAAEWELVSAGLIGAVGAAVPSLGIWYINVRKAANDRHRESRSDAIKEWQELVDRQQRDIEQIRGRADKLEERLYTVLANEANCQQQQAAAREQIARQEAVINSLSADVRRLQVLAHDAPPAVTAPCLVTVSATDGIVRACSPSSGPILGWLPSELIGQDVAILAPPDQREPLRAALAELAAGRIQVDPARQVHVLARKRSGDPVAIAANLFAWKTPMGSTMLNGELRPDQSPRRSGTAAVVVDDAPED